MASAALGRAPEDFDAEEIDADDGGSAPLSIEEETSFDDVALSLLLFFMVTSLFANFQSEQSQDSGAGVAQLPASGGSLDLGDVDLHDRIVIDQDAESGDIVLRHLSKSGDRGEDRRLRADAARGRDIKEAMMGLVTSISPGALQNPHRDGILVLVRLPASMPYSRFIGVWYALTALHRKNANFQARVSYIAWGSGAKADDAAGG